MSAAPLAAHTPITAQDGCQDPVLLNDWHVVGYATDQASTCPIPVRKAFAAPARCGALGPGRPSRPGAFPRCTCGFRHHDGVLLARADHAGTRPLGIMPPGIRYRSYACSRSSRRHHRWWDRRRGPGQEPGPPRHRLPRVRARTGLRRDRGWCADDPNAVKVMDAFGPCTAVGGGGLPAGSHGRPGTGKAGRSFSARGCVTSARARSVPTSTTSTVPTCMPMLARTSRRRRSRLVPRSPGCAMKEAGPSPALPTGPNTPPTWWSVPTVSVQGFGPAYGAGNPPATRAHVLRALVPVDRYPLPFVSPTSAFWMGPKGHVVTYYVKGGSMVNIVAVNENSDWVEESWNVKSSQAELLGAFATGTRTWSSCSSARTRSRSTSGACSTVTRCPLVARQRHVAGRCRPSHAAVPVPGSGHGDRGRLRAGGGAGPSRR